MKLILSRKGFDSSAGGCPNPIFPDGSMLALPIPDSDSKIAYDEINYHHPEHGALKVSDLVSQLTRKKIKPKSGAHLDPDMIESVYPRSEYWRPVLGQTGAAQGHLAKQGVGEGDVFVFFGVFRDVELYKEGRRKAVWRFDPGTKPKHIIWGWMKVGQVLPVDQTDFSTPEHAWLRYHPHLHGSHSRGESEPNNTLYLSSDSGVFPKVSEALILTDPNSQKPTYWQLPASFYPKNSETALTYHQKLNRWSQTEEDAATGLCHLQSAARGQEFVLDMDNSPDVQSWLEELISL